jgi:hypothetical protein
LLWELDDLLGFQNRKDKTIVLNHNELVNINRYILLVNNKLSLLYCGLECNSYLEIERSRCLIRTNLKKDWEIIIYNFLSNNI